jgi:threonine dehydratase
MITPQILTKKLAKSIELDTDLYLKREDLHPFGSHKGRSIPLMIERYIQEGWSDFIISSSGNAALAAIQAVKDKDVKLAVFVGKNINTEKLNNLKKFISDNIIIEQVENPKQQAFQLDKNNEAKNLRQSTDDTALLGYYDLAKELSEIKKLSAVFVPTSSGTTAQGLYEGFAKLNLNPQIHIVQTEQCHVFADSMKGTDKKSLADAIVDQVGHRKNQILNILEETDGDSCIAYNEEIEQAMKLVKETENIKISPNSALSIVGLQKALKNNIVFNGPVVCLITGK